MNTYCEKNLHRRLELVVDTNNNPSVQFLDGKPLFSLWNCVDCIVRS